VVYVEFQDNWTSLLNKSCHEDVHALVFVRLSTQCFFSHEKIVNLHKSTKITTDSGMETFQKISVKFYLNDGLVYALNKKTESSFQICTFAKPLHDPIRNPMRSYKLFQKQQENSILSFGKMQTRPFQDPKNLCLPEAMSALAFLDSKLSSARFSANLVSAIFFNLNTESPFVSSIQQSKFLGRIQSSILHFAYSLRERTYSKIKPLIIRHIRTPIKEGANILNLLFLQEEDTIEKTRIFLPELMSDDVVHILGASFLSECHHDSVSDINVSEVEHLSILLDCHESMKVLAFAAHGRNSELNGTYRATFIWLYQSLYLSNNKIEVGMICNSDRKSKEYRRDAISFGFYNTSRVERVTKEKTLGPFMHLTQIPLRVRTLNAAANLVNESSIVMKKGSAVVKRLIRSDHVPRPRHQPLRKNCCAIVTGGNRGLGFEMVKYLAKQKSVELIIITCLSGILDAQKQKSIEAFGCRLVVRQCDWSDKLAVERFSEWAIEHLPEITYLIHCAGSISFHFTHEISKAEFASVTTTKVDSLGSMDVLRIPVHLEYIMSSTSGLWPQAGASHYNSASICQINYAEFKQYMGLGTIATAYGPFKNVGMAALFEYV